MNTVKDSFAEIIRNYNFEKGSLKALAENYKVSTKYLKNIIIEKNIPYVGHKNKSNKPKNHKGRFCCSAETLKKLNLENQSDNIIKEPESKNELTNDQRIGKYKKQIDTLYDSLTRRSDEKIQDFVKREKQINSQIETINAKIDNIRSKASKKINYLTAGGQ